MFSEDFFGVYLVAAIVGFTIVLFMAIGSSQDG